jgi:hypothetical protein
MGNVLQLWLNPFALGFFILCICGGIWILSKSGPDYRGK